MEDKSSITNNKEYNDQLDSKSDLTDSQTPLAQGSNSPKESHDSELDTTSQEEDFSGRKRRTGIFRILAGGYLIYIFYSSVIEPLLKNTFDLTIHFTIIFSVYLIIGLILIIDGLRKIKK